MVVEPVAMPEGIGTHQQGQYDHADLKTQMVNDIDTEKRETGKEKRQEGTVNGTGQ